MFPEREPGRSSRENLSMPQKLLEEVFSASPQSLSHPLLLLGTAFSQPPYPTSNDHGRPHPYFDVIRGTPSFACSVFVPVPGGFVEVKFQQVSVFKGAKSKLKVPEGEEDRKTNFSFSSPQGLVARWLTWVSIKVPFFLGTKRKSFKTRWERHFFPSAVQLWGHSIKWQVPFHPKITMKYSVC